MTKRKNTWKTAKDKDQEAADLLELLNLGDDITKQWARLHDLHRQRRALVLKLSAHYTHRQISAWLGLAQSSITKMITVAWQEQPLDLTDEK